MAASKEIVYLDVYRMAGYFDELGNLAEKYTIRLQPRGVPADINQQLDACAAGLTAAVEAHLESQAKTKEESAETKAARLAGVEWLTLMKDGARAAFKGDRATFGVAKHALRVGRAYNPRRAWGVLTEVKLTIKGVERYRQKLSTRLTAEELDRGAAIAQRLESVAFNRIGALNDQIMKGADKNNFADKGLALCKTVLDAVELEFKSPADAAVRELFFGLDERMAATGGGGTEKVTDTPAPPPPG